MMQIIRIIRLINLDKINENSGAELNRSASRFRCYVRKARDLIAVKQRGKVIKFHGKDERDELAIFIAENPEPWIVTFSPPSTMAAALRNEDVMQVCAMKATSYHDDGNTVIFMTDNDSMGMGFRRAS